MSGVSRIRSVVDRVLEYLAQIGADPQDDDDTRAGKALLVLISVLILPVALLTPRGRGTGSGGRR